MKKKKKVNRRSRENSPSLLAYFEQQAVRQDGEKESGFTGANYRNAMQSVRRFLGQEAAAEDEVTAFAVGEVTREWVQNYIIYMKGTRKLSKGSMDFYVRGLRAVYNKAVEEGIVGREADYPFIGVNIAVPPTLKRTLSPEEMQALMDLDLSKNKRLEGARDLYLFLFYARGMCFVDVFNLTYSDVSGGYIRYARSKTEVPLNVHIEEEMQVLMDCYREEGSPYVFPALRRNCYKPGQVVSEPTACRRINRQLNALGKLLGLSQPLTVYVARHTWASFAEASGMSISYISQGLGHSSERVTRIYMKGIPSSKMDEANREMLNKMMRGEKKSENPKETGKGKKRCPILCKNETSVNIDKTCALINTSYLSANV